MSDEFVTIKLPVYRTPDGRITCRKDAENECQFLGFKFFGIRPVCMYGEQHDLGFYDGNPGGYIEADCKMMGGK